jgi:DNA-binding NarL/FixJ family response regulator
MSDKEVDDSPAGVISNRRCRIMLAGDHAMLLDVLISLLKSEFEVVGTATNGAAVLENAQRLHPDMVLIDVRTPEMSGFESGRRLQAWAPHIKLIYLTMEADEALATEAFSVGASAFLSKACSAAELQHAMRVVANGGLYFTPAIASDHLDSLREAHRASPTPKLSPRELEVLKLLVSGFSMKAVGRQVGIAPRTVAFHKYRAMKTLGLQGNTELIEFAIRHRWLGVNETTASRVSNIRTYETERVD